MDAFVLFHKASNDSFFLFKPTQLSLENLQSSSRDTTSELHQGPDGAPAAESLKEKVTNISRTGRVSSPFSSASLKVPAQYQSWSWYQGQPQWLRIPGPLLSLLFHMSCSR